MIGVWESVAVIILGSALVFLSGVLVSKIIEWGYGWYLERKEKLDCLEET